MRGSDSLSFACASPVVKSPERLRPFGKVLKKYASRRFASCVRNGYVQSSVPSRERLLQLFQARLHCFDQVVVGQCEQIGLHKPALGALARFEQLDAHLAVGQGPRVTVFQQ